MVITCYKCKKEVEPIVSDVTFENGTQHKKAECPDCKGHIKWLGDPNKKGILYFGKYKGESVFDIVKKDREYLEWLRANVQLKGRNKTDIEEALNV